MGIHPSANLQGDTRVCEWNSQVDLPRNVKSGLIDAQEKLKNISQIDFVHFSAKDVVRHPVVAQIIRAYEPANPTKFDTSEVVEKETE